MYNRYKGNGSRPIPVSDSAPPPKKPATQKLKPSQAPKPIPRPVQKPVSNNSLFGLLPKKLGELETEDILLVLILYLMYRESGDRELLIILGALFF